MLFNSYPFLFLFLPLTLLGYHLAGYFGRRAVLLWISVASLVFYAAWNRTFVLFLLCSVLVNFMVARGIGATNPGSRLRRNLFSSGVALNLAALFYYKYLFHLLVLAASTSWAARHSVTLPHPILLPLGISFFTFTQISYLVDLAQGQAQAQSFLSYLVFVTFFPHLIAGPILHHREIMPQFDDLSAAQPKPNRRFQLQSGNISIGLTWFVVGLGKKVLLADKLAPAADLAFSAFPHRGMLDAWAGLLIYSMQLYFDFSGYSDMAIGLARLFGVRFPMNFNSPWKATSVTEYWQRWHITLTRYITLYLYNPVLLGIQRRRAAVGKKNSRKALATAEGFTAMVVFPTMTTMLLTGIWHGAGLQFLIFGALHGFYLTANQAWRYFRPQSPNSTQTRAAGPSIIKLIMMRLGVFFQVALALVFFRADSLGHAWHYFTDLFGASGPGYLTSPVTTATAVLLLPAVWFLPNTQQILGEQKTDPQVDGPMLPGLHWHSTLPWALTIAAVLFATLVNLDEVSSFLYFQF